VTGVQTCALPIWRKIISELDTIGVSPDIVRDCFKHYLCSIDKGV
jgi:hypothetical protein